MREKINRWLELKRYNWKNLDISLLVVVSILLLISTYVLSIVQGDSFSLKRQLFGIIAGFVIVFIFVLIDYHDLCLYIPVIYIVTTLMAAATKFSPLGDDQGTDSYRWLDFKIIEFQPSEVCKIAIILALAAFFAKRKDNLKNFKTFFLACAIALVPTMFILVQSDLSSSIVMNGNPLIMRISKLQASDTKCWDRCCRYDPCCRLFILVYPAAWAKTSSRLSVKTN